jgi:protoheme IX farnesyltransferase
MSRLRRLTLLTIGLTLLLIALGGMVRATGAGLACPDWPLCHGRLVPPLEGPILVEYSHRLVASLVGFLMILVAVQVWRRYRRDAAIVRFTLVALSLLVAQVLLGGLTVRAALTPALVATHLGTAMAFLAALLLLSLAAVRRGETSPTLPGVRTRLRGVTLLAALLTFGQIVLGGYVSSSGAALACPDLLLCRGSLLPPEGGLVLIHYLHRVGALAVAGSVALLLLRGRTAGGLLRRLAVGAGVLVLLQIGLGVLNVATQVAAPVTVLHLLTATALFGMLILAAGIAWGVRAADAQAEGGPARAPASLIAGWRSAGWDYLALTKPRITLLLLATTATTMVVAAGGGFPLALLGYTMLGGALAAGAANAINMYWDRDVDSVMARTRGRPVPAGRIPPRRALGFGLALAALSVAVLGPLVNWLSAALALAGILFYVFIYTIWLKRSTPQNIVIGGAAGAVPPLVGWAAVTGGVAIPALLLFGIIFLWTPPHFWALALYRRADYAAAGIPMLPVVAGEGETRRQIVRYSVALVAVSLLLGPIGSAGAFYLVCAAALGAIFLYLAFALGRAQARGAMRLFGYSVIYLALLFTALAIDRLM